MRCLIAPSVLACDLTRLGASVRAVERAGADWHHLDIMDGHFVPNLTFGPDICQAVRRASKLPIDAHLMVTDPARYAELFIRAGASDVTFHIEVVPRPRPLIRKIHSLGARAGLVVRPATPVSAVFPFLDAVDLILVMSVEPGWTGQKFMPESLAKVRALRRKAGPKLDIEIDGGINEETIGPAAQAGANVIVAGAAVYRSGSPRHAIRRIRASLEKNFQCTECNR